MLVGRASELERLGEMLAVARAGRASALVLRGEAGIGKTTLLEWAAGAAEEFRVLRTLGVESEAELACAGLHRLVRPVLDCVDRLPLPQASALRAALAMGGGGRADRLTIGLGTLGLLAAAAEEGPVLCLVDDAQWLDTASADALLFAARRLDAEPVAMLFAARSGDRPFVASGLPQLDLAGIDEAASQTLLAASNRPLRDRARKTLLRIAAGNPLALAELPRALTDEQLLGAAPIEEPVPVTDAIQAAFLARVGELSPGGRRALLIAAVSTAAAAMALTDTEGRSGLAEAESAGLLRLDHGVVRVRHPLVRAAAYHAATGAERRAAHAAVAEVLEPDTDERAWHLAGAAVGPDERVAALLEQSGDRAGQRGAMAARAQALRRAAELTSNAEIRCRRLLEGARAAFVAGQSALARELLGEAEQLATTPILAADVAFLRWDAEGAGWSSRYPSFVAAAEAMAGEDPARGALMLSYATDYLFDAGRIEEAAPLHARAASLTASDPDERRVRVLVDSAWWGLVEMRCDEAIDRAQRALRAAAWSLEPDDQTAISGAAKVLVYSDHPSARPALESLVERARGLGAMPFLCAVLADLSSLDVQQGRLVPAYTAALEAFSIGEMLGGWRLVGSAIALARAEAYLGRDAACKEHVALARASATPDGRWWFALGSRALGLLELSRGDVDAAVRHLAEAATLVPVRHPGFFACDADHAEALIRGGLIDDAVDRLADLEDRATQAGLAATSAAAQRCRLMIAADRHLDAEAARVDGLLAPGSPFERARGWLIHGERLRRAGRRVDARTQLGRALAEFERLAAEPWAEWARRELRASGARVSRREPGAADVLTPQELQVALAVADGKTNREVGAALFISPKTVELHLSRVYRKLNVRSRAELIRLHSHEPAALARAAS